MPKKHTNMRIDEDMHKWITVEAAKQNRTFTNYVENVLMSHRMEVTARSKKNRPFVSGKTSPSKRNPQISNQ